MSASFLLGPTDSVVAREVHGMTVRPTLPNGRRDQAAGSEIRLWGTERQSQPAPSTSVPVVRVEQAYVFGCVENDVKL